MSGAENSAGKMWTPPELATAWGISPEKVLAWIRCGELRAVNVATRLGGRPRYRIDAEAVHEFLRAREAVPAPISRRRAQVRDEAWVDFY
jgi:excisionase family DNA binding protein